MWKQIFSVLSLVLCADSANILCYFYTPSISHQVVFQPIWKELSLRGHKVTVISTDILNDPELTNLTEIDVKWSYEIMKAGSLHTKMDKDNYVFTNINYMYDFFNTLFDKQLADENVQNLLQDSEKKFDLILVEAMIPIASALSHKYKAPFIGISSFGSHLQGYDAMGNPTHPIITPDTFLNIVGEATFIDRLKSVLYNVWYRLMYNYYILPKADKIARKYFGDNIPFLGDIERNMSLLLLNVNPILHPVRPNVPSIIELRQMHIKPRKPLPQDLQTYLDSATEGVIYFSLGSNVKSVNLSENVRSTIISALAELPYKVLWKWESDHLPNQPSNVITRKWLPQQDILNHKHIKAFVTQGGLQSMEEAIINGVPMIGMPFFGDQPFNVAKMVQVGIAKPVDFSTMTKDDLKSAIIEVATNSNYKDNIEKVRRLLVDEPMTGVEKAIWWIEYVLRHNGASHLKSAAVSMTWYEYFVLDVLLFLIGINIFVVYLMYYIVTLMLKMRTNCKKIKTQ